MHYDGASRIIYDDKSYGTVGTTVPLRGGIVCSFSFVGDPAYWTDGDEDTPHSKAVEPEEKVSAPRITNKKKRN